MLECHKEFVRLYPDTLKWAVWSEYKQLFVWWNETSRPMVRINDDYYRFRLGYNVGYNAALKAFNEQREIA